MNISISSRVFLVVALSSLSMLLTILLLAWRQAEALEEAFINSFAEAELEYFAKYGQKDQPQNNQSAQLISVYIPNDLSASQAAPSLFSGLKPPYRGEVQALGRIYAVNIHRFPEGVHYYAQDLAVIEEAEDTLHILMGSAAIIILILSLLTAWLAARHISKPVVSLVRAIKHAQSSNAELNSTQFKEVELQAICFAVNQFVQQNNAALAREKTWMAMASHEFRTPLSIISGAISVLQKRASISGDDAKTLLRIHNACSDMTGYVNTLLAIARRKPLENPLAIDIGQLLQEILDSYAATNPSWCSRINLVINSTNKPLGDKVVIKIALDNLLSNALNHSQGPVTLQLNEDHLTVIDAGTQNSSANSGGLGLYIINMACEYLHWRFGVEIHALGRHSTLWYRP
jgi:signal transduction histidine kinase